MWEAQRRLGLTHTQMGLKLGVHEHTWRRWLERGQVPARDLMRVAEVLKLDVEEPEPVAVTLDPHAEIRQVVREELDAVVGDVEDLLRDLLGRLSDDEPPQDSSEGPSAT